ncbi:MAG: hypothetical protein HYY65_03030 [Candidatus Tectomicrobia bacterium]|uniref:Uncharacterized protein n=1 Tax=Tectimicrobiota bacterium TaxID=2528274 RepID=A0A932GN88_UNCTE|nr:hypothetical protein [Candidatus Tectomicrobia bacterium]
MGALLSLRCRQDDPFDIYGTMSRSFCRWIATGIRKEAFNAFGQCNELFLGQRTGAGLTVRFPRGE